MYARNKINSLKSYIDAVKRFGQVELNGTGNQGATMLESRKFDS
jgi:hypothetical protein